MSKPFNELHKRLSPEAQERAGLLLEYHPDLRALLAERDALREAGRFLLKQIKDSSCVTYTGSKATNLHAYKELESILNASPAGEDLRVSEGEKYE